MKTYIVFLLIVFPVVLSACSTTEASKQAQQELIQKNQMFLTPPGMAVAITRDDCTAIEVAPGTQVMWINADTVTLAITLEHLDDAGAVTDTENYELQPETFMTKVFSVPETYRYTCSEDMDWYSTIIVKD